MIRVHVPASKSITQRALVLASLSDTPTEIENPLDCDDSQALVRALQKMGVVIEQESGCLRVNPPKRLTVGEDNTFYMGNAGTAVRFLTGLSLLVKGTYVIDGNEAMRGRPMPGLLAALRDLGVSVRELGHSGCPPIELKSQGPDLFDRPRQNRVVLQAGGSSQELSALLLSGCRLPGGLRVEVQGSMPSMPYVEMTRAVMSEFGVPVTLREPAFFDVLEAVPRNKRFTVETDWSSASYPLAAAWLTGKAVEIDNLRDDSIQGDREFPKILKKLDGPSPRILSMGNTPDLVPGIVACALFAEGTTEIVDAAHLRIKESNRIDDLVRELRKLGAMIEPRPDGMVVKARDLLPKEHNGSPGETTPSAALDPHDDHRLAMAFGLISLKVPSIQIMNKRCVSKSYPVFWEMLEKFR